MSALPDQDTCKVPVGLNEEPDRCGAELTVTGSNTEGWVALCTWGHQTIIADADVLHAFGYDE